ncbi:MAG: translesion DNA synthesis-associated protein ImuA [Betaproteobacteria bacterium]|nr:translesion DNA synthesis-associated protein ImuA [Betaproteobacteria bacterium]NBU50866.1 translesion DNA synthesis-associated protein ImuA [Betaproteobacteria bacterium]
MGDKCCINIQYSSPIMSIPGPTPSPVGSDRPALQRPAGALAPHRRLRVADIREGGAKEHPARVSEPAGDPAALPGVWRADTCATPSGVWPTGHPALDAQLPGGGWPAGGLVELLCAQPGLYEGALLAPHWARTVQAQPAGRWAWVMLGHSPWRLHAPGVARLGLPPQRLLCLQPATEADAAWAVEQMLHSAGVTGIWWLTRHARSQHLRRLQWAAQAGGIPLFVSRPLACRQDPSPAPLRLHLQSGPEQALRVHILKRQGPRHEQPVDLPCTMPLHLLPRRTAPRSQPHVVDRPVPAPVAA